jgi:prepilin-type N-terminal cleavage/methylation domain-containing protein
MHMTNASTNSTISARRAAFTLIELMVVTGIIAILISLALPALAKTKVAAKQTLALSNLRQVHLAFEQYADSFKSYPFLKPGVGPRGEPAPDGFIGTQWLNANSFIMTSDAFEMQWMWAGPMSRFVTDVAAAYPTWVSPGLPKDIKDLGEEDIDARDQISVRMAECFVAKPELYTAAGKDDVSNIHPTSQKDVTFPSNKVMLYDAHVAYLPKRPAIVDKHYQAPAAMAFVDGHGEAKDPTLASQPAKNPMKGGNAIRIHSTADGVRGRDY